MTIREYRCTRNFLYSDDDLVTRQGHYIHAHSREEAWQIMASRYPQEIEAGFTVQDWSERSGQNVVVFRVERDSNGNIINSDRPNVEPIAQRVARETGLELIEE